MAELQEGAVNLDETLTVESASLAEGALVQRLLELNDDVVALREELRRLKGGASLTELRLFVASAAELQAKAGIPQHLLKKEALKEAGIPVEEVEEARRLLMAVTATEEAASQCRRCLAEARHASPASELRQLLESWENLRPQMNLVNLSTAIHRVAKIAGSDPWQQAQLRKNPSLNTLLNSVCTALLNVVEATEVQPQSVSNASSAGCLAGVLWAVQAQFKSFELSTTLWALAKLGSMEVWISMFGHNSMGFCHVKVQKSYCTFRFNELAEQALRRLEEFKPQETEDVSVGGEEISNMLWGFATNSFFHEDLQSQHLANILWAFARVRLSFLPLCTKQLQSFKPQAVGNSDELAPAPATLESFSPEVDLPALGGRTDAGVFRAVPSQLGPGPSWRTALFALDLETGLSRAEAGQASAHKRSPKAESGRQLVSYDWWAYQVPVNGSDTLVECAGKEVLGRLQELDVNALVHLLKVLAEGIAAQLDRVRTQEMQSLGRLLNRGAAPAHQRELDRDEIRARNQHLERGLEKGSKICNLH
ncbi:hypothetical protein AK812_SmicGene40919 [Symbiodinium microadriaticum]|uniref:Uncharacterized protein n=1 Tax=Symbiodinium microadriaticum TaxID=2951 RepID=A0A1Q9C7G6_SYMMI|nr:hypothetical protein AK812_SmicGene40919 [Symbiodinium microadriaticum]